MELGSKMMTTLSKINFWGRMAIICSKLTSWGSNVASSVKVILFVFGKKSEGVMKKSRKALYIFYCNILE